MTTEEIFSGLWLSVEAATAHLQKILADQTVKEQALRKQFQELFDTIPIEMEKVGRKYEVYSIGTKKAWIDWLVKYAQVSDETALETDKSFVLVSRKQLEDIMNEIPMPCVVSTEHGDRFGFSQESNFLKFKEKWKELKELLEKSGQENGE